MDQETNSTKKKRYSVSIVGFEMKFGCSEGMMKAIEAEVTKRYNSTSDYMRNLIMKDLQIDIHGKSK